LVEGERQ